MPDWLWWLLPVLGAPLAAAVWTAWTGRSRGPEQPAATMREHQRFRAALGDGLRDYPPGTPAVRLTTAEPTRPATGDRPDGQVGRPLPG